MPGDGAGASFRSSLSPTHPLCVSLWGFVPVQGRAVMKRRIMVHTRQPHQGLWRPPSVFLAQTLFLRSCMTGSYDLTLPRPCPLLAV